MWSYFIALLLAFPAAAVTVDRIAAVVGQVLPVSEIMQMVELRSFAREGEFEEGFANVDVYGWR